MFISPKETRICSPEEACHSLDWSTETWFTIQLLWPQLDETETTFQSATRKLGWLKGHGRLWGRAKMHRTNKWITTEETRGEDGGRRPSPTILEPSCSHRIALLSLAATCGRCEWTHLPSPWKSPYRARKSSSPQHLWSPSQSQSL